jgi:hypothetical protein
LSLVYSRRRRRRKKKKNGVCLATIISAACGSYFLFAACFNRSSICAGGIAVYNWNRCGILCSIEKGLIDSVKRKKG